MSAFSKSNKSSPNKIREISVAEMAMIGGGAVTQEGKFTCVTSTNGSKTCVRTK